MVEGIGEALGIALDPDVPEKWLPQLGGMARMIGAVLRNTSNPTMLEAGYKTNVIPSSATAVIDGRFLPGQEEALQQTLAELVGDGIETEVLNRDIALETSFRRRARGRDVRGAQGRGPGRASRSRT